MEQQKKKRERALNFTQGETECLINLVVKYSNVIENKISDAVHVEILQCCRILVELVLARFHY